MYTGWSHGFNFQSFYIPLQLYTAYKTTTILLDGKRVKLQLWDTSGQGRFCTIIRSYSRGAQGVLLVYDITNRWSFDGLDRWLKEVDEVQFSPQNVNRTLYILFIFANSMHPVFQKCWSAIVCIWHSIVRWLSAMPKCTHRKIVWHFLKCRRCAISIYMKVSRSCRAWHCNVTVWSVCGVQIKVCLKYIQLII